jgi:hypothetical protein
MATPYQPLTFETGSTNRFHNSPGRSSTTVNDRLGSATWMRGWAHTVVVRWI